ncbi:hypothetical protein SCLCIDRAFT_468390 [Scleroderma citrinum Foug A]|uniref:Uncharacterized protein n=1 Tax=Scleroderma citrinum Foug A TaxID=1036808 RepID=A0A0C3EBT4_9AGAM|nr:hypothetical protein SCLCIDRAFT_468390 [Scleroderma citrinum Foug A]
MLARVSRTLYHDSVRRMPFTVRTHTVGRREGSVAESRQFGKKEKTRCRVIAQDESRGASLLVQLCSGLAKLWMTPSSRQRTKLQNSRQRRRGRKRLINLVVVLFSLGCTTIPNVNLILLLNILNDIGSLHYTPSKSARKITILIMYMTPLKWGYRRTTSRWKGGILSLDH